MDIIEAMNQRKSIRAFRPDPVPQKVLADMMELALRAPSWGNTQPWEVTIVGGKKLEEIRRAFVEKAREMPNPDLPLPLGFPEPYSTRSSAVGKKIFETKGIGREDKEKRKQWTLEGTRFFNAPSVIYIYLDRSVAVQNNVLSVWPVLDCGLLAENIMLLAAHYGLGTIAQAQAILYPDVLRKILQLPDSKLIVLGIAIGYPNWADPVNQFRTEREPMNNVVKWCGFD